MTQTIPPPFCSSRAATTNEMKPYGPLSQHNTVGPKGVGRSAVLGKSIYGRIAFATHSLETATAAALASPSPPPLEKRSSFNAKEGTPERRRGGDLSSSLSLPLSVCPDVCPRATGELLFFSFFSGALSFFFFGGGRRRHRRRRDCSLRAI